jgi:hypothetical protein
MIVALARKLLIVLWRLVTTGGKRDVTAAGHYAAIACELAPVHFQGSSSSIFVFG